MEQRPVDGYVYMGTAIRYLCERRKGELVFGDGFVADNVEHLLRRLREYEFHVTVRVLWQVEEMAQGWRAEFEVSTVEAPADERRLTEDEAVKLKRDAQTGRETLLAEAAGKIAYIAEDKRYTVKKLTQDIASLFTDSAFQELPKIAQEDFVNAGRAIAFMLPTAGAFHILRGTEAALREFYVRLVKRNRIAEPRMWAAIVSDLRSKATPPPELLTTSLDSLRKHFRNPTQHPEKTYDVDEVQDLLATAIDVVNQMYRHMHDVGR